MNPRIGSGMQQAHKPLEEQTVEVERDHEGGTRGSMASTCRRLRLPEATRVVGAGSGLQRSCRWRGDLWKTLKEALGGTEPSRCEMRLRTRDVPDGRADVGPGNRDGERATAGKPVITSVNPYAGESRPALVKAHEPGTCRTQWMLEAPNTRATHHRPTARTNAGRHAGIARQLASRSSP